MGPLSNSSSRLHGLSCWTHQPIINPSSSERIRRTRQTYATNTLIIRSSYARIRSHTLAYAVIRCHKLVIRYQYVSHTLCIRSIRYGYAMDTSIPTPMSTFPMQFVGKLDVLGLWKFSSYFLYTSGGIRSGHTPWCDRALMEIIRLDPFLWFI